MCKNVNLWGCYRPSVQANKTSDYNAIYDNTLCNTSYSVSVKVLRLRTALHIHFYLYQPFVAVVAAKPWIEAYFLRSGYSENSR